MMSTLTLSVLKQPFVIAEELSEVWTYRNGHIFGSYLEARVEHAKC
jgi:hypothetical protein